MFFFVELKSLQLVYLTWWRTTHSNLNLINRKLKLLFPILSSFHKILFANLEPVMLLLTPYRITVHNIHHLQRMKTFQVNLIFTVFFKTMPNLPLFFRCSTYFVSSTRKFCYVLRFLFNFQIAFLTVAMFYKVATNSELVNTESCSSETYRVRFLWASCHIMFANILSLNRNTRKRGLWLTQLCMFLCKHSSFNTYCWFINIELLMPEGSLPNTHIFSITHVTIFLV